MASKKKVEKKEKLPLKPATKTTKKATTKKGGSLKAVKKKETLPVKPATKIAKAEYPILKKNVHLKSGAIGDIVSVHGRQMIREHKTGKLYPISQIKENPIPKEQLLERELLRTPKQRYMDESHTAKKVISPDSPQVIQWWLHPEVYDVKGIDTAEANPKKQMEKENPNFVKKYAFIDKVEERSLYPHSKGLRQKGLPLKPATKTTKKTTKTTKKTATKKTAAATTKGLPLKPATKTTKKTTKTTKKTATKKTAKKTLPLKSEVKATKKKATKTVKKEKLPVKPVAKTTKKSTKKATTTKLAIPKTLQRQVDYINKTIGANFVCKPTKDGTIMCYDATSKIEYTPEDIGAFYKQLKSHRKR